MKLSVIGLGYVGLVSAVCLAELGHDVTGIEKNKQIVLNLTKGILHIYEPGLKERLDHVVKTKKLIFSNSLNEQSIKSDIIFCCLGTRIETGNIPNMEHFVDLAKQLGNLIRWETVIVTKSTLPLGYNRIFREKIESIRHPSSTISLVSNPEFLAEGTAVNDFIKPDRIILGSDDSRAIDLVDKAYIDIIAPRIKTTFENAEMIKYAANCFLAMKISFVNTIARIADVYGGNVDVITKGMGLDKRIGLNYLKPSLGFGGSCLPKDVETMTLYEKEAGIENGIMSAILHVNQIQKDYFYNKIETYYGTITGITLGVWGGAFKENTNDIRESTTILLMKKILASGGQIRILAEQAEDNIRFQFGESIVYCKDPYELSNNANGLIITSAGDQLCKVEWNLIAKLLKQRIIFDGNNRINPDNLLKYNIRYEYIGGCVV